MGLYVKTTSGYFSKVNFVHSCDGTFGKLKR